MNRIATLRDFISIASSLFIPVAAFFNVLLIIDNKYLLALSLAKLHDWTFGLVVFFFILLVGVIVYPALAQKEQPPPSGVKGFGKAGQDTISVGKRNRWWLLLLIAVALQLSSVVIYIAQHTRISQEGIVGIPFSDGDFNDHLRSNIESECRKDNINHTFALASEGLINKSREDSLMRHYLFSLYYKSGLIYYGTYNDKKDDVVLLDMKLEWVGGFEDFCQLTEIFSDYKDVRLMLNNFHFKIRTSVSIASNFIKGYWYLHHCQTMDQAKRCFSQILDDTTFQRQVAETPENSDMRIFYKNVNQFKEYAGKTANSVQSSGPTLEKVSEQPRNEDKKIIPNEKPANKNDSIWVRDRPMQHNGSKSKASLTYFLQHSMEDAPYKQLVKGVDIAHWDDMLHDRVRELINCDDCYVSNGEDFRGEQSISISKTFKPAKKAEADELLNKWNQEISSFLKQRKIDYKYLQKRETHPNTYGWGFSIGQTKKDRAREIQIYIFSIPTYVSNHELLEGNYEVHFRLLVKADR